MLKKIGMVSLLGLIACSGCGLTTYVLASQAIVNTGVIVGAALGFPTLVELFGSLNL